MDFSNTLTTGSNGMVGSYLNFGIKTDRRSLDITDLKEVLSVVNKYKPNIILHLAAETDVDRCERDPQYAYFINSIGTYNIALAAKQVGAKLVYISTNAVFDGKKKTPYQENDIPNPQNYYGHSKFLGEAAIKEILKDYLILRVSWMFGGGPSKDQKFVAKIINQIKNPEIKEIRAVTDQIGAPTFGKDLLEGIKILLEKEEKGIFHLPNQGIASRYDIAKFIVDILRPEVSVVPVDSTYFNLDAKRIGNDGLISKIDIMRPWQDAMAEYLKEEWGYLFNKK